MKQIIEEVYAQIRYDLIRTPIFNSQDLDALSGAQLHFKMENQQTTGSFKLRGVLSKFSALMRSEVAFDRVVAASTGNHALAVCYVSKAFGISPLIFVPESISSTKLAKLQQPGVEIYKQGEQSGETELVALEYSRKNHIPMVHPYNDSSVIAGQGTLGLELHEQLEFMDLVFVPVGGGGLISGIGAYLKAVRPSIKIIGVQPENANEMAKSVATGRIVEPSRIPTISDGTAGGLDPDTITYGYCKELVDKFVLVEEQEIINALKLLERHMDLRAEPAAALALAGLFKSQELIKGRSCIGIICGGNIDPEQYLKLVSK